MRWRLPSQRIRAISIALVLVAVGALAGWYVHAPLLSVDAQASPVRVHDEEFPLISPLVSVRLPSGSVFPELARVQADVQHIITRATKQGDAQAIGMYFRIPDNAHSFGINDDAQFDLGSLIKVPIMIAYLKEAEDNPAVLNERFSYVPSKHIDPLPNALAAQLPPGTYTAERLIEAMIVDSDNVAKDILIDHTDPKVLQDVFNEMDANFLKDSSGTISPRAYIVFFNRLYGVGFLSRASSNRALELLSKTTFVDGLDAGVPANVTVSHKYGERGIYEDGALIGAELHDCGIVYADKTTYYLCVMTRGTDVAKLANVIKAISAAVYSDRASFAVTP